MPTYEYQCEACGHRFEKFQSIKADPIKVCPVCEKKTVVRLISAGATIIFKGGGFYETDYRSDSYNKAKKADTAPSSSSEPAKSEPAKSESSKPAESSSTPAPAPKTEAPKPAPKSE